MGSGRNITPREFPLSVTLPPLRRTVASSPMQPKQSTEPSTSGALELQQLQPTGLPSQLEAATAMPLTLRIPSIEDLIAIALELGTPRREAASGAQKAPASQHESALCMDVRRSGGASQHINTQLRTAGLAGQSRLADAQTPVPECAAGPSRIARSLQQRPELYACTPIEGVPERISWSRTPGNVVAGTAKLMPQDSRQQRTFSISKDVTPVEGVPERLLKRRRVSLVPQMQLPLAAAYTSSGGGAYGSLGGARTQPTAFKEGSGLRPGVVGATEESKTDEHLAEDGDPRAVEAAYDFTGAVSAALEQLQAIACSTAADADATAACSHGISSGDAKPEDTGTDICAGEFPIRNDVPEDAEQEDFAAAASAAARSALERLQALAYVTAPDALENEATVRNVSHTSPSIRSEPSGASTQCTPAAVKIKRLAIAVEEMVHQVTETLKGLPSAVAHSLLPSGLPPHPPSVARHLAASASAKGPTDGSCGRVTASADQTYAPDGQPGSADIIHRARIGALAFPSRTPSPMGGVRWPPILQGPEPQLASGCTNGEDMFTPPIGGTQVYLAGDFTTPAAIAAGATRCASAKLRATAAGPSLVETATSPFQIGDLPTPAAASASPFSADDRCGTEESEESAGAMLREGHEISPGQHCGGSPDYSNDGLAGHGDNQSAQQCGGEDEGLSTSDSEERNGGGSPTQSSSLSSEQVSGDTMGQSEGESAETSGDESPESSGDSPEHIRDDRSPGARGANGAIGLATPAGLHHLSVTGDGVPPRSAGVHEPEPTKILASVLRHDYDRWDAEDDDLAAEVVMSLPELPDEPEQPLPPKAASQGLAKSANTQGSAGKSSQSAAAQQQRAPATTAPGTGVSEPTRLAAEASASAAAAQRPAAAAGSPGHRTSKGRVSKREYCALGRRKSLVAANIGLVIDEKGTRRSTRTRVRPLEYWRGEGKSYGRDYNTMPTVTSIMMRTPEPQWPLPSGKAEKKKRKARTKEAYDASNE
ncbi:hypothetical protein Vretimale_16150 [Volvox reticuliferus]|nr:hypothetical protein Vretimale_16150 [Volvox reticuliferus]